MVVWLHEHHYNLRLKDLPPTTPAHA